MANIRRLARSIGVDISVDNTNWLKLLGRVDNAPAITPNKVDSTDVDSGGFTSNEVTLQSGVLTVKYNALSNAGVPDSTQELIRVTQGQFGDSVRLYVRWYDTDGGNNAYTARSIVEMTSSATAVADLMAMQVVFTLDGTITAISNPFAAALAPVLLSATPSGVTTAGQVAISGQGFTGVVVTTGVKFGGTNATSWYVASPNLIVAVMPTGSAGSAAIVVTNATGASNSLPYTRT